MRTRTFVAALACLALPMLAVAQSAQLKLPSFADLKEKSIKTVDMTVDSTILGVMGLMMDDADTTTAALKKTVQGLKSVQIRSYQFKSDFEYPRTDVDAVRSQLSAPGWTSLVQTHDRQKNEDVDIYIALDNKTVTGLALIAANRHELTIINIVGAVDLNQVGELRKAFGVAGAGM
jgi:hypothetical protein